MTIHDDYIADMVRLADNLDDEDPIMITVETPAGTVRVPCIAADLAQWLHEVHGV